MTEEEKARRIALVMEHHAAYGVRAEEDEQRMRTFLNDTIHIPLVTLKHALRRARQESDGQFPPTCGAVIQCALTITYEMYPRELYTSTSGERAVPGWYKAQRLGTLDPERPREIGGRTGAMTLKDAVERTQ